MKRRRMCGACIFSEEVKESGFLCTLSTRTFVKKKKKQRVNSLHNTTTQSR